MVTVEIENRSGADVDEHGAEELARRVLSAEGIDDGDLGLLFVGPDEMRTLKREHLGRDEATDVLSFPIDGRDDLPDGVPRQLGDAVLCPQVVGEKWQDAARPRPPAPARLRPRRRDGTPRVGARVMAAPTRRGPSLLESFNFAFEGVIHVLRTQRNMRIHFAIAAAVLIAAVAAGVGRIELIALLLAISFVLIAEMINSALEAGIDVVTTSFDPLAKLAKDIAAGAVLIATVNAVAVGYLVFSDAFANRSSRLIERLRDAPAELTVIALVLVIILVLGTKAYTGRGTPLRGGLPSGHAAVAFGGWMAVTQVVGDSQHWFLITSLTFLMAVLVAQTRIESGVHSFIEVVYGGVLGALAVLVIFQVFG